MLTEKLRALPIAALPLSVRTRNCLLNENKATLGEAADMTDAGLLGIPNFGKMSLRELRGAVAELAAGNDISPAYAPPGMPEAEARRGKALAMRREGRTFREIGAHFGVTIERVRQMVSRAQRTETRTAAYKELITE